MHSISFPLLLSWQAPMLDVRSASCEKVYVEIMHPNGSEYLAMPWESGFAGTCQLDDPFFYTFVDAHMVVKKTTT